MLYDVANRGNLRAQLSSPAFFSDEREQAVAAKKTMRTQVNRIADHLAQQWEAHEQALQNTNQLFQQLLEELMAFRENFDEALALKNLPVQQISVNIDADRSVGILTILWHTISFTTRGNTYPLALHRPNRDPLFTGRIIALQGDFRNIAGDNRYQGFTGMLPHEVSSLFVPSDVLSPAVMRLRHQEPEETFLLQADAPRSFLIKTVELLCGGGFYHETMA